MLKEMNFTELIDKIKKIKEDFRSKNWRIFYKNSRKNVGLLI
jgi:hypothetical protein